MNLSQIRNKYKQILDESDESSVEGEVDVKSRAQLIKTRVFTEHNENLCQSHISDYQPSSKVLLSLKERIAQGIKNLGKKDEEICGLKQQIAKLEAKNTVLEQEILEMKQAIQKQGDKVVEEKVKACSLEADIAKLNQTIQSFKMDKELIYKQIDFYKREIASHKVEKQSLHKKMQAIEKEMREAEKLKSINYRLKDDLKRMHIILNEYSEKQASKKIENKHFLGKPYKEHQCWFSQNLVGEVEHFLRKEQIAQGNKEFLANLVKFIDHHCKQPKKQKREHLTTQQKQEKQRSKHHSSVCQRSNSIAKTQILGKSTLKDSIFVSRYTKNGSKRCTQSLLYTQNQSLQIKCEQILSEFHKIMSQALTQSDLKKSKLLKLTEEMTKSILSLFDEASYNKL